MAAKGKKESSGRNMSGSKKAKDIEAKARRERKAKKARKDRQEEGLQSLYGLTPRLEAAIFKSLSTGATNRVRSLVAPLHAADQADLIMRAPADELGELLRSLGDDFHYDTLNYLDDKMRLEVVKVLGIKDIAEHLEALNSDEAVHIVEKLAPDQTNQVLAVVSKEERSLIEKGLSYPEKSAGRLMQHEVVTVPSTWTVGRTIDYTRASPLWYDQFYHIFVVDEEGEVVGEVNLGNFVCSERPTRIADIMDTDVHSIPTDMNQEEVAVLFKRYHMVSAPVVDAENKIVGVVTVDDVVNVIDVEAEEDLMALAGVGELHPQTSSMMQTIKGRGSWLFVNLLTAVLASIVIGIFDETIERLVALAVLMPIVASMGGNAGTQTVTVAVRAIALRQMDGAAAMTFVYRELAVALVNGVFFAALAAALSYIWFSQPDISVVMSIAMFANILVAGLGGTLVPLGLVKIGVDPAIASSVFITTITDVVGFFVFLGLAAAYLI